MPIMLNRNENHYNRIAEGEVANLLAHFNSDYVMNTILSNINNRFNYNPIVPTMNLVSSFEINFKDLIANYPMDKDNINQTRNEVYADIINAICSSFGLQIINDDIDLYIAAYNLYDIFVANYSKIAISFFSNYIYHNRVALYNAMDMARHKKDKDSSSVYFKKIYNDIETGILVGKIKETTYFISGIDIGLYDYLMMSRLYNKETCDYIMSIVQPIGDIFKNEFCKVIENPTILTDIRLCIQTIVEQSTESSKPNIISNK